jgi:hypothetical protein
MALTPAQQATLKAFVEADPVLSIKTPSAQSAYEIKAALAVVVDPVWYVYRTNMPKQEVQNAVAYANMTPAQSIPASGDALQIWIAKALLAQGKQFNLQNLLMDSETLNFALPNIRAGIQDSLTALPTKADGTTQTGGWNVLQNLISRSANVLEKLLSTGTGSQGSPATMAFEGSLNENDIGAAMGWSF